MAQIINPPPATAASTPYVPPISPTTDEKNAGSSGNSIRSFSVDDIEFLINVIITNVINGAPAALNQLNELAAALGNDPNYATTVTNALMKRLRADAPQTFSAAEVNQLFANLGLGGNTSGYVLTDNGPGLAPSFKVSPTSTAANTILNGAGAPANSTGNNGDFYIDTTNNRLYGPKAANAWPGTYVSLAASSSGSIAQSLLFATML